MAGTSRGKLLLTVGFSWLCTLWWREGGREIDLPAGVLRLLWPVWKKAQSGEGEHRCHSAKDLFNKPLGLKLSLRFRQFCTTHPFKNMFCLLWLCFNACPEWRTGMCCILHYCCFSQSAEEGRILCAHLKSEFYTCMYKQDFCDSQV